MVWNRRDWSAISAAVGSLRYRFLLPDPAKVHIPNGSWTDTIDPEANHWVTEADGAVAGCARLSVHADVTQLPASEIYLKLPFPLTSPIGAFGRLVLVPSLRGTGARATIDKLRREEAVRLGCRSLVAFTHAGPKRVAQLTQVGFTVISDDTVLPVWPFEHVTALAQTL